MLSIRPLHQGLLAELAWTGFGFIPLFVLVAVVAVLGETLFREVNTFFAGSGQELVVGLNKKDVSLFRVLEQGSASSFSQADLEMFGQQSGVLAIHPLSYGSQPTEASVALFGRGFRTEMVIQAVDPTWLEPPLQTALAEWKPDQLIPMVVNTSILAIYNHAYAKSAGLPELSETALKTPIVSLRYGKPGQQVEVQGRIVGLSPKVALGVAMPAAALTYLHSQAGLPAPEVTEVVLRMEPGAAMAPIEAAVHQRGFVVAKPSPVQEALARLRGGLSRIIPPLGFGITFLLALWLNQGFGLVVRASTRRHELLEGTQGQLRNLWRDSFLWTILLVGTAAGIAALTVELINQRWMTPLLAEAIGRTESVVLAKDALAQLSLGVAVFATLLNLLRYPKTRPFAKLDAEPGDMRG